MNAHEIPTRASHVEEPKAHSELRFKGAALGQRARHAFLSPT